MNTFLYFIDTRYVQVHAVEIYDITGEQAIPVSIRLMCLAALVQCLLRYNQFTHRHVFKVDNHFDNDVTLHLT